MFSGSMTALVTPFRDGEFDEKAYRGLIEFQIGAGTDALVPCGTTGESATLSHEEHDHVVDVCIAAAAGRVPVIAGAGSNSTREALRLTRHAKEAGADAALLITPYYNKPTQEGLYRHFAHVAERVDIPIVLYNVPGRTGVNLLPETVARLAEIPNIVAIKEATADLRQASRIIELCGERIAVISGDDFTVLPLLAIGGKGVISVVSNVAPALMARLVDAFFAGDYRCRARGALPAPAALGRDVHRDQPDPRQDRARADGEDRAGVPAADVPDERQEPGAAGRRAAGRGPHRRLRGKGMERIRAVVAGAGGRMGQRIIVALDGQPGIALCGACERPGHPSLGCDAGVAAGIRAEDVLIEERMESVLPRGDVLIDFTAPEASLRHVELAVQQGKALVLGTTGLDAAQVAVLEKAARKIPIVYAPNMSVGVNLLFKVLGDVAAVLGDSYDVEIVEAHHRFKKDAPSGTAKKMAQVIAETLRRDLDKVAVPGRSGMVGERTHRGDRHLRRARRRHRRRPHRDLRGARRAHRDHAPRALARHLRARGGAGRKVGRRPRAGPVRHDGRPGSEINPLLPLCKGGARGFPTTDQGDAP